MGFCKYSCPLTRVSPRRASTVLHSCRLTTSLYFIFISCFDLYYNSKSHQEVGWMEWIVPRITAKSLLIYDWNSCKPYCFTGTKAPRKMVNSPGDNIICIIELHVSTFM